MERAGKPVCGSRVVPTGKDGRCDGINDLSDHKTAATSSIMLNRNSSILQSRFAKQNNTRDVQLTGSRWPHFQPTTCNPAFGRPSISTRHSQHEYLQLPTIKRIYMGADVTRSKHWNLSTTTPERRRAIDPLNGTQHPTEHKRKSWPSTNLRPILHTDIYTYAKLESQNTVRKHPEFSWQSFPPNAVPTRRFESRLWSTLQRNWTSSDILNIW